jgi:hypothetical protein
MASSLALGNARTFIEEMHSYLIDQERAAELIRTENLPTTKVCFPFTEDAIDALTNQVSNDQQRALPAAIISWISNAAIEAWRRRHASGTHQLVTGRR